MIEKTEKEIIEDWKSSYDKPLVSMCCIAYNHEKFIAQTLDSMLIQETDFPFEIIIRDDCSTDNTRIIIQDYAEKFPHIITIILETENQYSKGVNPLVPAYEKANGKYITILEGDDYWKDKLKLQKQVDFLEKNSEYILSYHNSIIVDENDHQISEKKNPSPKDFTQEEMLSGEVFILTNTVMFRKVENISSEQLDNVLNGDMILWHLLGYHGKSKYQEDIIYAAYRVHSGGVWSSLDEVKRFENHIKIIQVLRNLLPDNYNSLKKRMEKNMNKRIVLRLYKFIRILNFKEFWNLIRFILSSEDLSISKLLFSIPSVLLQKIMFHY